MGWDLNSLPEHVLNKIPKSERRGHLTAAEATEKNIVRTEREHQGELAKFLSKKQSEHRLLYLWFRIDKPTRCLPGYPDFTVFLPHGRTIFIELKTETGRMSDAQMVVAYELGKLGFLYVIVNSSV